ncbi:AraC family transcriptional regulator [Nocardioides carbamazepini]|uniref:AraC family transcriptional regulator n=1 Tax=Nocardioides carbamazepini TaxID=2854259 RepID=UPI00214A707A|nr:AraC family transcriptional regulator [Nocardioides carbamazepini]MCR1783208.1 AraC family transcriptional regulator [Nocardioides carbamazepini]
MKTSTAGEPHLRAWVVSGFVEVIEALGGDPTTYEKRFHVSLRLADQGKEMIPAAPLLRLMEAAADELSCPDFGIRVGLTQGQDSIGPVMVAAVNCADVREAYESGIRYLNALFSAFDIAMVDTADGPRTVYTLKVPGIRASRQFQEWCLAVTTKILPIVAGPTARLRGVYFSHPSLLAQEFYDETFGCPVRFGETNYGVDYFADDMERAIPRNNPEIRAIVSDYLDSIIATSGLTLEHQLLALVQELLPTGGCNLNVIAEHHFVSVRTMQRRLAAEGLVFERLVDDVRRERAFEYLADPDRSVSQVAGLLGYVEQSSFTHAFRRWSGRSPRAWRAERVASK